MSKNELTQNPPSVRTYAELLKAVEEATEATQRQIETLKTRFYWWTGKLIQQYIGNGEQDSIYGRQIVSQLAADLNLERSYIYRMMKFAQAFPSLENWPNMSWSHYRELLIVEKDKDRKSLAKAVQKNEWSVRELRQAVRHGKLPENSKSKNDIKLTPPKNIRPGVYKVKLKTILGKTPKKYIDYGFYMYGDLPHHLKALGEGDLVEMTPAGKWRKARAKFTNDYSGEVEKVVDGDTLRVLFKPEGQDLTILIYLRLKSIDAKPLKTPQGTKAQTFLENKLKKNPKIHFRTYGRDRHHRWIADIFSQKEFLNQLLLDKSHALKA